jgi:hypothetical protein
MPNWRGRWTPETPVRGTQTPPLYLSVEDAVARIRSSYPPDETKPPADRIWTALHSGRSVAGYVWLKEAP